MSIEKFDPDNGQGLSTEERIIYESVLESYMDEALSSDRQDVCTKVFDLTSAPINSDFIVYHMSDTPGNRQFHEINFRTNPQQGRKCIMPGEPVYARLNQTSTYDLPNEFFVYGACEDGVIDFTGRNIGKIALFADLMITPIQRVVMTDFDPEAFAEAMEDGTVILDEENGQYIYMKEGDAIILPPVLGLSYIHGNNRPGRPLRTRIFDYESNLPGLK